MYSMIITVDITEDENKRIEFLRDEIGVRTAPDLLMYLVNKEYKTQKMQESFSKNPPSFATMIPHMMDVMKNQQGETK
jgi:hypothetical protein